MKKIKINLIVLIICIILTITSITLFILKNYLVSSNYDNWNFLNTTFNEREDTELLLYASENYGGFNGYTKKFPDKNINDLTKEFREKVFDNLAYNVLLPKFYKANDSYITLGDLFISANSILLISAVLIGGLNSYKIVKNLKLKHSK
ncbi:hypothetical protein [Mycoplasmopsis felis]|uniref:hypothetical protein n=1 Tax=Mycoplasmopsis felis TaxID=33923 RepID=UPI002AFDEDD3|nr:hypothetical protein [Mycoplasmopsis felis]WQQ04500.1 hypothetical protein RRG55_02875 [Mycoplasmopsis felis]